MWDSCWNPFYSARASILQSDHNPSYSFLSFLICLPPFSSLPFLLLFPSLDYSTRKQSRCDQRKQPENLSFSKLENERRKVFINGKRILSRFDSFCHPFQFTTNSSSEYPVTFFLPSSFQLNSFRLEGHEFQQLFSSTNHLRPFPSFPSLSPMFPLFSSIVNVLIVSYFHLYSHGNSPHHSIAPPLLFCSILDTS